VKVIARVDVATRLALELTCVWSRRHRAIWPRHENASRYDYWAFADDCATRGYLDLLRYAFENGAPIDDGLWMLAMKNEHVELAEWLRDLLLQKHLDTSYWRMVTPEFIEAAAKTGNERILALFNLNSEPFARMSAVTGAAASGNIELTTRLLEPLRPLANFNLALKTALDRAARAGQEEAAKVFLGRYMETFKDASPIYFALLVGAVQSGHEARSR